MHQQLFSKDDQISPLSVIVSCVTQYLLVIKINVFYLVSVAFVSGQRIEAIALSIYINF